MKEDKKYFKKIDYIRFVSCIGVLLYHLGYLKGGFLSVCCFFVLSGYLSYLSLSKKKEINYLEYYKKRFLHIYLPLVFVVFLTTCVVSFIPSIHWFQLKPETTSVILGFNNFWQLSVNADYFARHVSSPFMHFWYIAILIQFDLIFPVLFSIFQKTKEEVGKFYPLILILILIIGSTFTFLFFSYQNQIMISYYDTLGRSFSLFLGVLLGFIHTEYHSLVFKKKSDLFFYIYLFIFIVSQFFIDSNFSYYAISMIVISLITCRMIDYAVEDTNPMNTFEKGIHATSDISYEIYLFQYPVIFFFQYVTLSEVYKLPIMILLIFGLSYFLHYSLNFKEFKKQYARMICFILLSIFAAFGLFEYVAAKDYSDEMNALKDQLDQNEKILSQKRRDYDSRIKEQNDQWNQVLMNLENDENGLKEFVQYLPIVGVGDSVMLGAVPSLYAQFPNGYFDAAVSRTDFEASRILRNISLGDNIVIHLGTNGQCGLPCQQDILATVGDRHVFYVTVSNENEVHVNQSFYNLAAMYPNVSVIDWYSACQGHPEYFAADGIHLTGYGMDAYVSTIYSGIYDYYYQQYEDKKKMILEEHEEQMKTQISFYGNDSIMGLYDSLQKEYPDSVFKLEKDATFDTIYASLQHDVANQLINHNVIISLDGEKEISEEDYQKIIALLKDYSVYILFVQHSPYSFTEENIHVLDFNSLVQQNPSYLMVDNIHLSKKGNKALKEVIKKGLEN